VTLKIVDRFNFSCDDEDCSAAQTTNTSVHLPMGWQEIQTREDEVKKVIEKIFHFCPEHKRTIAFTSVSTSDEVLDLVDPLLSAESQDVTSNKNEEAD